MEGDSFFDESDFEPAPGAPVKSDTPVDGTGDMHIATPIPLPGFENEAAVSGSPETTVKIIIRIYACAFCPFENEERDQTRDHFLDVHGVAAVKRDDVFNEASPEAFNEPPEAVTEASHEAFNAPSPPPAVEEEQPDESWMPPPRSPSPDPPPRSLPLSCKDKMRQQSYDKRRRPLDPNLVDDKPGDSEEVSKARRQLRHLHRFGSRSDPEYRGTCAVCSYQVFARGRSQVGNLKIHLRYASTYILRFR